MVEQWNSRTIMVEQCGAKVEQSWWKSVVEKWNSNGGTVGWNSGTVWWNSGIVWWNSGTLIVEQCDETVEQ